MARASELRQSGESLIGCGQYAVDCVQPKCVELQRISNEFKTCFNLTQSQLRDAQQLWLAVHHVRCSSAEYLTKLCEGHVDVFFRFVFFSFSYRYFLPF